MFFQIFVCQYICKTQSCVTVGSSFEADMVAIIIVNLDVLVKFEYCTVDFQPGFVQHSCYKDSGASIYSFKSKSFPRQVSVMMI